MDISNMKNILVLKDLPSNLVEEAIVVLKANQKIKKPKYVQEKISNQNEDEKENDGYIVREAEMLVASYISKLEEERKPKEIRITKKYNRLKIGTCILAIMCWIELVFLLC